MNYKILRLDKENLHVLILYLNTGLQLMCENPIKISASGQLLDDFWRFVNEIVDGQVVMKDKRTVSELLNEWGMGLEEGETKVAKWSKKFHQLEYWDSRNTTTTVNCSTMQHAKAIIKKSGIEQKFEVEK